MLLAKVGKIWARASAAALVAGEGDSVVIGAGQVQVVVDFLDALSAVGSLELQTAVAAERANLPPLTTFVGMTMAEARDLVMGYGVYLPLVVK